VPHSKCPDYCYACTPQATFIQCLSQSVLRCSLVCRLAVDMGLGSIVRLSWDLISMSTATDYLVSLIPQLCLICCASSGLLCLCRPQGPAHSPHNQSIVPMLISVWSWLYGQLQLSSNRDIFECLQDHTRLQCNLLGRLRVSTSCVPLDCITLPNTCSKHIVMLLSGRKCHVTNQRMLCPGASSCWSDFWRGAVGRSRGHFGPSQGHPTPVHAIHCHQR